MDAWSEEVLHDGLRIKIRIDKLLFDSKTEHQRLMLFESKTFGRVLTLAQTNRGSTTQDPGRRPLRAVHSSLAPTIQNRIVDSATTK